MAIADITVVFAAAIAFADTVAVPIADIDILVDTTVGVGAGVTFAVAIAVAIASVAGTAAAILATIIAAVDACAGDFASAVVTAAANVIFTTATNVAADDMVGLEGITADVATVAIAAVVSNVVALSAASEVVL